MLSLRTTAGVALAVLALGACSSDSPVDPPPPGPPASVVVPSPSVSMPVNTSGEPVVARVLDVNGRPVPNVVVTWTGPDGWFSPVTSATDAQGVARTAITVGTQAGTYQIAASIVNVQGLTTTASFALHVTPGPPARVVPATAPTQLGRYGRRQFAAWVIDIYGNPMHDPAWSSTNPAVATVNATGMVTAVGAGTTIIRATAGSAQADMPLTVSAEMIADSFDAENLGLGRSDYRQLLTWEVTRGSVDVIGRQAEVDFLPGNGLYLDMDGYVGARLESRETFVLPPGTYTLSFDLAGSHRGDHNVVTVSVGPLFDEQFARASGDAFIPVERTFTVPAEAVEGATVRVVFDQGGSDGYGALLDNVRLVRN